MIQLELNIFEVVDWEYQNIKAPRFHQTWELKILSSPQRRFT